MSRIIPISDISPGDLISIERPEGATGSDGKPVSNYGAGEYIVLRVGNTAVYCTTGKPSHDIGDEKSFNIAGRDRWDVIAVGPGRQAIEDAFLSFNAFDEEAVSGKRQWCESVYTRAAAMRRTLQRIYTKRWGEEPSAMPAKPTADGMYLCGTFYPCPPDHRMIFILKETPQ